uniref:Uncharacterized protein n=1 Tax=Panagrellus redivivus TaxID=6233 RepID=A0A7E4UR14_PANRE
MGASPKFAGRYGLRFGKVKDTNICPLTAQKRDTMEGGWTRLWDASRPPSVGRSMKQLDGDGMSSGQDMFVDVVDLL